MYGSRPSMSGQPLDRPTWAALRAAGFSDEELRADQCESCEDGVPFGPASYAYTRAQAIADGVLVDLAADADTRQLVQDAGVQLPVAMTATAYDQTVLAGAGQAPDGPLTFPAGQTLAGRLREVLAALRDALQAFARQGRQLLPPYSAEVGADRVDFEVSVWDGRKFDLVRLWCQCRPGPECRPALTVMLAEEDLEP